MFFGSPMEFILIQIDDTLIRLDILYYIEREEYEVHGSIKNERGLIVSGKEKEEVVNQAFKNLKDKLV
ncbi:hypothetical protein JOC75_000773 [Metabacillus crassostreae]|uniref:hypothetical protein n=1 Tax=Metabacillus crassostreae TaxID=929098 RepID=UPI001958012A|nr:hypothetical protein [Metabacillus crassostreae]MBM7602803.1 hypothetical protein [Metabacillus crassostreae]